MGYRQVNYYNDNDAYCAAWLRNLIAAGLIPEGEVDERSIKEVRAADLGGFAQCHFFAGIGGWSLALQIAGWPVDRPVWTGSCPCQPFSLAGKQQGFTDERHLWPDWFNLIRERGPAVVLGEQVASAAAWLGLVRSDLEAVGYAVGAIPIQAASAGADHLRDRFWFVADSSSARLQERERDGCLQREALGASARKTIERNGVGLGDAEGVGRGGRQNNQNKGRRQLACPDSSARSRDVGFAHVAGCFARCPAAPPAGYGHPADPAGGADYEWVTSADGKARRVKSGIRLLAHDVPARVAKLRAFGNAIVPACAAEFIAAVM